MTENVLLKKAGATWWHTDDYASPSLSKASLGEFFYVALSAGVQIGEIWPFNHKYARSSVLVSVYATNAQKDEIERKTKYRFRKPPKISVAGEIYGEDFSS